MFQLRTKTIAISKKYQNLLVKLKSSMILNGELKQEPDKRDGLSSTIEHLIREKALKLKLEGGEAI